MGKLPRLILLAAGILFAGCGTVANLGVPTQAGGLQPFGGVRNDLTLVSQRIGGAVHEGEDTTVRVEDGFEALLVTAVDLPLSLVGDAATLLITVPAYLLQPSKAPPPPSDTVSARPASPAPEPH
jgi:uncharacterized protein YceK